MKLELKNSLSVKLLRVVLLSALIVGVVLSCAQIVFDAYKTRQAVANDAQRILDMFRDPSTQAVYSLDREMGMQVIEGLFQDDAVRMASIGHPNETMLAEKSRELQHSPSRWLTDLILGQERTFTTQLVGRGPYSEYYGDLSITLDTATYGQDFIISSVIIFISGVLRALAMGPGAVPGLSLAADQAAVTDHRAPDHHQPRPPQRTPTAPAQGPRKERAGHLDQYRQPAAGLHRAQHPLAP